MLEIAPRAPHDLLARVGAKQPLSWAECHQLLTLDLPTLEGLAALITPPLGLPLVSQPTRFVFVGEHDAGWFAYHGAHNDEGIDWRYLPDVAEVLQHPDREARVLHLVVRPDLGWSLDRHCTLVGDLRRAMPDAEIRGYDAFSIWQMGLGEHLAVEEVLTALQAAGLATITGGMGSDMPSEAWTAIHRAAHQLGMRSALTLVGAQHTDAEALLGDLFVIRTLQEEAGSMQSICLVGSLPGGQRRWIAIARITLDTIPYVYSRRDRDAQR